MLGHAEPARRARRELHLLDRPGGPRRRLPADFGRREGVERGVVRGMHGHQLALQMRGQLSHLEAALRQDAFYLVTVGLALGGFGEVEQSGVPAGDLDALEAEPRGPAGDGLQAVERRRIARALRQENGRPFDRPHRASSVKRREISVPATSVHIPIADVLYPPVSVLTTTDGFSGTTARALVLTPCPPLPLSSPPVPLSVPERGNEGWVQKRVRA